MGSVLVVQLYYIEGKKVRRKEISIDDRMAEKIAKNVIGVELR